MKLGRLKKPSAFLASTMTALFFAEAVFSVPGIANPVAGEFPQELRQKIKYVIIIYPENRSFDSLFGHIRGVNGLKKAAKKNYVQTQPNGTPFATLPQPNTNGIPGITTGPDPRFPAVVSNQPFEISSNVPITDRHGDLIHRFYTEQYQINDPSNPFSPGGVDPKNSGGAPLSKFSAYSTNAGLVLGNYDAQFDAEGRLAREFTICDNAFHSAFGGSFLNHQWLIAARTPVWPANPSEGSAPSPSSATVFGADGFPVFTSSNVPSDGALTNDPNLSGFDRSNAAQKLGGGDYWAVNTLLPLRGPAGGLSTISPAPPPPGPITQPTTPTSDTPLAARLPLQTYDTIGDRLSDAHISWAWYSGGWDDAKAGVANYLFQFHHQPFAFFAKYALKKTPVPATATAPAVPGEDSEGSAKHLKDVDHDFFRQLQNGTLPTVSLVKPIGQKNEHPGYASVNEGSEWLASTIEKIRESKYWHECAVFVMYDEHGGIWDHVVPPAVDDWGPGLRVPLEVISPFAKRGFVDHTQYETVSLLKFLEGLYRLPALNTRDAAALAPISSFRGQPDLVVKAKAGQPFTYELPAYNDPRFFLVFGHLDGVQTDPLTGHLFGIPKRAGDFEASVLVAGQQGPEFFTLRLQVESDKPHNQLSSN
jgi:acid phosphatase